MNTLSNYIKQNSDLETLRSFIAYQGEMRITSNRSKRTYTIRYGGNKYRTTQMSKAEFEDAMYNTPTDWKDYIKNNECIILK